MNQRNEVLSLASHEIKNPLTALKLQVEMVKREMDRPEGPASQKKIRSMIDRTHRDVIRLSRTIDDMLLCSRMGLGNLDLNLEYFNLQEFCDDFEKNHLASFDLIQFKARAPVLVYWDKFRMEQVFLNLLASSFRLGMKSKTKFFIRVSDQKISIEIHENEHSLHKDIRKVRIFIVQEIIKMHQGVVELEKRDKDAFFCRIQIPFMVSTSH